MQRLASALLATVTLSEDVWASDSIGSRLPIKATNHLTHPAHGWVEHPEIEENSRLFGGRRLADEGKHSKEEAATTATAAVGGDADNATFTEYTYSYDPAPPQLDPAFPNEIDIVIAVAQADLSKLDAELKRVSEPQSRDYGRYWSLADPRFVSLLGAKPHADKVERWLREEGQAKRVDQTLAGDFIRARLRRADAERLFQQPLQLYKHGKTGELRLAAQGPLKATLPEEVAGSIEMVVGLELPRRREPRAKPHELASRHGAKYWASKERAEVGSLRVVITEARDRAFQVHIAMLADDALLKKICSDKACERPVQYFEGVFTPVRLGGTEAYLLPATINGTVKPGDCSLGNITLEQWQFPDASNNNKNKSSSSLQQMTCTVAFGPSLDLVNFASTRLTVRGWLADGTATPWEAYSRLIYPALSTTAMDMRGFYKVPPSFRNTVKENSQAIANFMQIGNSASDAQLFRESMGIRPQPPVEFVGENGPVGVEGNIDLQWIQAVGDNVATTSWSTPGGAAAHEPFLEWLIALANCTKPPLVHSVSYGENEEDYSYSYEVRGNAELAKLGLRGLSVLIATGDTGVQGAAQDGGTPPRCAPFAPVWPASSPYITAVGGTMISNHVSNICNFDTVYAMGTNSSMPFACPEMVVGEIVGSVERGGMITGGGGFSDRFPMPDYQKEAVAEYLGQLNGSINSSLFNASGRAYPDISAVSQNVPVFFQGQLVMVGGTSSSAPIVAGIISLLNGERLAEGRPQLGFLNPWLYKLYQRRPSIVQDVLAGNNSGGNMLLPPALNRNCPAGFPALPGWDAATGLGTPDFSVLIRELEKMRLPAWQTDTPHFV
mmetsp:Transcript_81517/g.170508  ORF Transcript_81517/g.170508 Transcript_81517/m.170508 type:complete len:838 (-) Transcript_81517:118-2631(-)